MVASLSLSWGQCLLLLVHVDEHALAILHTQLPRMTKSYEKNLPCSQTKLTPKTTVIDTGSNGTGKNENITGVERFLPPKNYIINKGSMYFVLDKLIPHKIKKTKNPKIQGSKTKSENPSSRIQHLRWIDDFILDPSTQTQTQQNHH